MKVYLSFKRMILTIIITIIVCGGLVFGMCWNLFLRADWAWQQPLIIGVFTAMSLVFAVFTPRACYYEVNKKYVIVVRYRRKLLYNYSDVLYIDEEKSEKKKVVHFYTKQGHARYITFDKNAIVYKTMIANCKNRLSKEEFEANYPNVKL